MDPFASKSCWASVAALMKGTTIGSTGYSGQGTADDNYEDVEEDGDSSTEERGLREMMKFAASKMKGGHGVGSGAAPARGRGQTAKAEVSLAVPTDSYQVEQMHMKMQMQHMQAMMPMQELLMEMRSKKQDGEDLFDDGSLDGLLSIEARAVRNAQRRHPKKVPAEYRDLWEQELNAQGRPWGWTDVGNAMGFRRYKLLYRAFLIIGQVEESMNQGKADAAPMEAVQGIKALCQFVLDGRWTTGCRFTQMSDPFQKMRCAGTEIELEAALGAIRVEEDLKKITLDIDRDSGVSRRPRCEQGSHEKKANGKK